MKLNKERQKNYPNKSDNGTFENQRIGTSDNVSSALHCRYYQDYSVVLKDLEQNPLLRGIWAIVGKTQRIQGWKIHLSSIPVEAVNLLNKVVPVLKQWHVPFKVAKDEHVLCQLNEGDLGGTQVGKFITIYPDSDHQAKQLAKQLVLLTVDFQGPVIISDLRLGKIVYARYGNFNPIITRDRLGQVFLSIYAPDGSLQKDSYEVPFKCHDGIDNPFKDFPWVEEQENRLLLSNHVGQSNKSNKLFGPGYLVLEILKEHPKGLILKAIDLRSQELVSAKILKQGRQHCLSDEYGRDMRVRLIRQAELHCLLQDIIPIPKADPYFEVDGDGYLPIEYIDGQSIESLSINFLENKPWIALSREKRIQVLGYLEQLLIAVEKMHSVGYVHRDLTASNVWIGADGKVYLLDLELAHAISDPTPAFGLGTSGFMSPEQESRMHPAINDDIYALGCCMTLLLTGMDPRRIIFANEEYRTHQLFEITNGASEELIHLIARCLSNNPVLRPGLLEIIKIVQRCIATEKLNNIDKNKFYVQSWDSLEEKVSLAIRNGLKGLLEEVSTDPTTGLWLSAAINNSNHGGMSRHASSYELRRSANRGVAGVVYLLSRLERLNRSIPDVRGRVKSAVEWLITAKEQTSDSQLPGLHFGEAGVAVAIAEAISSGIIDRTFEVNQFLLSVFTGEFDWPDITHGAAGQGVAALYCYDLLQDKHYLEFAHRCADYLVNEQEEDGSWIMPVGVEGMSGETLTGFAHGVSGIVYFLADYARRFDSYKSTQSWKLGVDWLMKNVIHSERGDSLNWYYSDSRTTLWKWWCHGAPGISLTFLRLYEQTRNPAYAEVAAKALQCHPKCIIYPNLSQCHGLSGLGEAYLEADRVLGGEEWRERATWIANLLINLARKSDHDAMTWLVEDPHVPTADLMVGAGGVIHFLLRFALKDRQLGYPLLLNRHQT